MDAPYSRDKVHIPKQSSRDLRAVAPRGYLVAETSHLIESPEPAVPLPCTRICVQYGHVKRRDLERRLRELGWTFLRHGGNHDVWTDGDQQEAIPRHAEINELLARSILRRVAREKK
jgi:mRNA interferase HicA